MEKPVQKPVGKKIVPSNFGPIKNADVSHRIKDPYGDTMEIWLIIDENKIIEVSFTTDGNEVSVLCGSGVAYYCIGMKTEDVKNIKEADIRNCFDLNSESDYCITIAIKTLNAAVDKYLKQNCNHNCSDCKVDCNERKQGKKDSTEKVEFEKTENDIKNKFIILSGKGGVGKSTVAVNLALGLSMKGYKVGLLDVDVHGPTVPVMLGMEDTKLYSDGKKFMPASYENIKVISVGFMLKSRNDAIIWRGPAKTGVIRQFLEEVYWGELDYLIVDCPPGTGDEPLSVIQFMGNPDGAVLVTTPQNIAAADVKKSVTFCNRLNLKILGIVENMNRFTCPACGDVIELFCSGGGKDISEQFKVPFLGSIPFAREIGYSAETGDSFLKVNNLKAADDFNQIIDNLI